jgi:hypothetical protein
MTLIGMSKERIAAAKLSESEVGQALLALGVENCADHRRHREMLIGAIDDLGGTPVAPHQEFDLTSFLAMSTLM